MSVYVPHFSNILALNYNDRIKKVCNGEYRASNMQSNEAKTHGVKCMFVHNRNPYLLLGPFMFEIKRHPPFRAVIHDLLTAHEINQITESILPQLTYEKSASINIYPDSSSTTYKDHSKVSTLYFNSLETDKSVMKSISNKVQLATYLISNEYGRKGSFKASLYGLGGMAEKHSDAYGIEDEAWLAASTMAEDYKLFFKTAGDIVATAIFYLSDLPLGGGTYFCSKNAEEVILPKKGSAVVWTNLDSSGLRDKLQDHGGCPVAFSNKFIITQWYNMYYQFNTYPCDIKKSAMFNQQLAYFS